MTPSRPAEPSDERPPDDTAPRWHAPPRPRSAFAPPPMPPPTTPPVFQAEQAPEASPARSRLDRFGPPFLTLVIALIVGATAWPVVRDATAPAPTATVYRPARAAIVTPTPFQIRNYQCFYSLTLAGASGNPSIDSREAERRFRESNDFPLRASRLTLLGDARLVVIGPGSYGPRATPTPAPTRLSWLLTFGRTEPFDAPLPARSVENRELLPFTYALLDANSGEVINTCDGVASSASAGNYNLPKTPSMANLRRSAGDAWAAGPAGGRVASWLPFTAAASFGTAIPQSGGDRELVVEYYAAGEGIVGERIQVISTPQVPLLRLGAAGGTPIALDNGREARLDLLGTITVLTWREGDLWYQIIAVRPQQLGAPFDAETVVRIAAGLRSREDR